MTKNIKGEKAMEYIADHPLYASTSGITYEQAIRVAHALNPQWEKEIEYSKYLDTLTPEQLRKELA